MAEAEEKKEERNQFEYQCHIAETIDEIEQAMNKWRKRSNNHANGDWVMAVPEPLKKKQGVQRFCWIAHPNKPGKGGPEVACRAAYVALMQGRLFDIEGDFSSKSEERKAALEKDPAEWPVLKYPNGKEQAHKPMSDDEDEDEEKEYYGSPCVFAVRYKSEIYTGDTLSDGPSLTPNIRMQWSGLKDPLVKAFSFGQAKFHIKQMNENTLANGKALFLEKAKAHKKNLA